jgi:hypothetical protein
LSSGTGPPEPDAARRPRARRAARVVAALALGLGLLALARAPIERALWRRYWLEQPRPPGAVTSHLSVELAPAEAPPLVWHLDDLRGLAAGRATRGAVAVYYPAGVDAAARRLAELLDAALARVRAEIGLPARIPLEIHLVEVPGPPRSFELEAAFESARFVTPLPFASPNPGAVSLLAEGAGPLVLHAAIHELAEASLVLPGFGPTVLPDIAFELGPLPVRLRNRTRWLREGLASYVAYAALGAAHDLAADEWPAGVPAHAVLVTDRPLAALARVGEALFTWSQFDAPERDADLYAASFGLFLLAEARFGRPTIRRLVEGIPGLGFPDGAALEALAQAAWGQSPRALARSLRLAQPGLEAEVRSGGGVRAGTLAPGGAGERAGVRVGDRLLRLGDDALVDLLDWDLALLHAGAGPADLLVERDGSRRALHLLPPTPAPGSGRSSARPSPPSPPRARPPAPG